MATKTALTTAYAQVAADISALKLIQVPLNGRLEVAGVELVAAASAPAATVFGVQLLSGETIISSNIPDIGTTGKLYARMAWGNPTGAILTL